MLTDMLNGCIMTDDEAAEARERGTPFHYSWPTGSVSGYYLDGVVWVMRVTWKREE